MKELKRAGFSCKFREREERQCARNGFLGGMCEAEEREAGFRGIYIYFLRAEKIFSRSTSFLFFLGFVFEK